MTRKYKKGDAVKVWSLQSWSCGGFLDGREAVVKQDQNNGQSVFVSVVRNFSGEMKLDPSYEVYAKQLELITPVGSDKPKAESRSQYTELLEIITELQRRVQELEWAAGKHVD